MYQEPVHRVRPPGCWTWEVRAGLRSELLDLRDGHPPQLVGGERDRVQAGLRVGAVQLRDELAGGPERVINDLSVEVEFIDDEVVEVLADEMAIGHPPQVVELGTFDL